MMSVPLADGGSCHDLHSRIADVAGDGSVTSDLAKAGRHNMQM